MEEKIIVPLHKHIAILYPAEIQRLLLTDQELYALAIKRGKGERRCQANEHRQNRNIDNLSPKRANK